MTDTLGTIIARHRLRQRRWRRTMFVLVCIAVLLSLLAVCLPSLWAVLAVTFALLLTRLVRRCRPRDAHLRVLAGHYAPSWASRSNGELY